MRYIYATEERSWYGLKLNILSVVWLGVGIKTGRRSTWGWSWHPINLWIGLHLSPSSCSSKEVTSKAKKQAEDYERERDHHHHPHLLFWILLFWIEAERENEVLLSWVGKEQDGAFIQTRWFWYWILFCSVMKSLTFNFPTDTFLSLQTLAVCLLLHICLYYKISCHSNSHLKFCTTTIIC